MAKLDERSRRIIEARWLKEEDPATLQELADEYGVSAERIRQIESKALKTMRAQMAARAVSRRASPQSSKNAGPRRRFFRPAPAYSSTCVPSSTTRLVGIWKNSDALVAFFDIDTNSRSRHIAMPGATVAISVSRETKNDVSIMSNDEAALAAVLEQRGHVGILLEAEVRASSGRSRSRAT